MPSSERSVQPSSWISCNSATAAAAAADNMPACKPLKFFFVLFFFSIIGLTRLTHKNTPASSPTPVFVLSVEDVIFKF